jgi:hypothetical protein
MAQLSEIKDKTIKSLFIINRGSGKVDSLGSAFLWGRSPEGHEFWRQVNVNPSVSFDSIKHLLPKGYKPKVDKGGYTPVKSLYRKVKTGMKYKAVTKYGTKFSGVIRIDTPGNILLYNNSGIGLCKSGVKGYRTARSVGKGSVDALKTNGVAKIEIMYNIPETPVKPKPKPKPLPKVKPEPAKTFIFIISLKGVKSGTEFTAKIEQTEVTGKIQFEDGRYFLCQNKKDGTDCKNKLGYKYSWVVNSGTSDNLKFHEVTNLQIEYVPTGIPTKTPEFKDLQVTFCETHVIINGVKITDEQLEGIVITQGLFEIVN